MIFLGFLGYVVLALLIGYAVVSASYGRLAFPLSEMAGLTIAMGFGVVALLLLYSSLAGFAPSRRLLVVLAVACVIALLLLWRKNRLATVAVVSPLRGWRWSDALLVVPIFLGGYALLGVIIHAAAFPMYEGDATAIWAFRARQVFAFPLTPTPHVFTDSTLSYEHFRYPLLVPFMLAGAYGAAGGLHDQAVKTLFPLLYMSLALLCFSAARRALKDRVRPAFLAAIVMAIPPIVRWAGAGYADIVLTLFYTGSVIYLIAWLDEKSRAGDLIVAGLFCGLAALTKNEGVALFWISAGILVLWTIIPFSRTRFLTALSFTAGVLVMIAPFFLWSRDLPRSDEDYPHQLTAARLIENFPRLKEVLPAIAKEAFSPNAQGAAWIVLVVSAALGWGAFRGRATRALWTLLLVHVGLYVVIYGISPWKLEDILHVSLDRVWSHVTPVAVILAARHWASCDGSPAGAVESLD